jgi:hypothetical protein
LFAGEGQRFLLLPWNLFYFLGGIVLNPSLLNAEVKECYQSLMLIVEAGWRTAPRIYLTPRCRHIQLR